MLDPWQSVCCEVRGWVAICAMFGAIGVGCGGEPEAGDGESLAAAPTARPLSVFVVNYPLQYFAERIGGAGVRVELPVPADVDPAYWSPDPETIVAYQDADLILLNGAGYARWIELASLPQARLVDTSASFSDQLIPLESGPLHSHGPQGEHSHAGYAFTTWLDPSLAAQQAGAIAQALSKARPGDAEAFRASLARLQADLSELDRRCNSLWAGLGGQPLLFSHPVYQYLERRYSLDGVSLHWEPGVAPDEEMWRELETLLEGHPAGWMIWEDEPLEATQARLERMGVDVLVYRPLASAPVGGDLLTGLNADLAAIEAALDL